jgi:hypothetical protein
MGWGRYFTGGWSNNRKAGMYGAITGVRTRGKKSLSEHVIGWPKIILLSWMG